MLSNLNFVGVADSATRGRFVNRPYIQSKCKAKSLLEVRASRAFFCSEVYEGTRAGEKSVRGACFNKDFRLHRPSYRQAQSPYA